jgi:putative FmdB family regulatory protein
MPTYEYVCKKCGRRFETTCHLEDRDKLAECPDCHSKDVQPVFSSFTCEPPKKW